MRIFFADDSRQRNPTRPGMGPLVAIGGISIPFREVYDTGRQIDEICGEFGFPPNQEFKWSPGKELWMRTQLIGSQRQIFLSSVIELILGKDVKAIVVIEDSGCARATAASNAELDVTKMFLERVDQLCGRSRCQGLVVVDRPSGNRKDEDAFLFECLETLQSGTNYLKPKRIVHNVLSTPSKLSRLLQAADIIVGSTLAFVSGENHYAPPIFELIKGMLDCSYNRIGGYGVKIHPDYKYCNLYHWLLGDESFWRGNSGSKMPLARSPYSRDPFTP